MTTMIQTDDAIEREKKQKENRRHLLLAAIASVPVFFISNQYLENIHVHDNEQVATAATMSFLVGIYTGRYVCHLWSAKNKPVSNFLLFALGLFAVGNIVWLFVHAEFPLQDRPALNFLLFWLSFFLLSITLGMLIKLGRLVISRQINEANLSASQSQSELQLLQSQLSPHFLFNTLNNLYGLSITQHEKLPPLLLKLSELLRYSVYDAKEFLVPLKDETEYIKNYIEFEKLRMGDRLLLSTDIEQPTDNNMKIAPMLLIVFIENAFKHSKNSSNQQVSIDIKLRTWGKSILFSVKNSYSRAATEDNKLNKHSGVGLANALKRLDLLYKGEYNLQIDEEEEDYNVMLQLKGK